MSELADLRARLSAAETEREVLAAALEMAWTKGQEQVERAAAAEARVEALEDLNGDPLPVIAAIGGNLRKTEARLEAAERTMAELSGMADGFSADFKRERSGIKFAVLASRLDAARAALACPPQQRGE